jgi:nicotinamidase-related amidase
MPLSLLDTKTAFISIDLQKGLLGLSTARPLAEVAQQAGRLAAAFRAHGLPVILVNVAGAAPGRTEAPPRLRGERPPDWTEMLPELGQQPSDLVVTKRTWGAFTGTGLEALLRERGVTQVVIGGVATSAGVESTARHAHELGFNVVLATDAMTDASAEAHAHALADIFPRISETGSVDQILALLEARA